MSITIILVDDHPTMREGLRAVLSQDQQVVVVGEAGDGRAAVQLVADQRPDVVVMDIAMADLNGVEATRQILRESPETRVIGLSAYGDKRYVLAMLDAGAHGYILKSSASHELLRAIQAVAKGQHYLSPEVAGAVVNEYVGKHDDSPPVAQSDLGAREREILQLLAEGHTSKAIGVQLHISVKTVETHRRNIMRKLDLHNIASLTKYAVREGLTSLDG